MDPKETVRLMIEAAKRGDWEASHDAAADLIAWQARGGFKPLVTFEIPGLKGPRTVAGSISHLSFKGNVVTLEIRTQGDGYHRVRADALEIPTDVPPASGLRCGQCGISALGLVNAYGPNHGETIEETSAGVRCTDCL